MLKIVYEDEIQIVYEDEQGARITTLKNRPTHDFWGRPYMPSEKSETPISPNSLTSSSLEHRDGKE